MYNDYVLYKFLYLHLKVHQTSAGSTLTVQLIQHELSQWDEWSQDRHGQVSFWIAPYGVPLFLAIKTLREKFSHTQSRLMWSAMLLVLTISEDCKLSRKSKCIHQNNSPLTRFTFKMLRARWNGDSQFDTHPLCKFQLININEKFSVRMIDWLIGRQISEKERHWSHDRRANAHGQFIIIFKPTPPTSPLSCGCCYCCCWCRPLMPAAIEINSRLHNNLFTLTGVINWDH